MELGIDKQVQVESKYDFMKLNNKKEYRNIS